MLLLAAFFKGMAGVWAAFGLFCLAGGFATRQPAPYVLAVVYFAAAACSFVANLAFSRL